MQNARIFADQIAFPLCERFSEESMSDALRWAAIVSLNQIADYLAEDRLPTVIDRAKLSEEARSIRESHDTLNTLGKIADALKHSRKIKKGTLVVDSKSLRDDLYSISDIYAESNVFAARVVDIDGLPVSIMPVIDGAITEWKVRLNLI